MVHHVCAKENKPYKLGPDKEELHNKAGEVRKANKILTELGKKRPSSHHRYAPELHVKIGRFATSPGNQAAIYKYSKPLGRPVKAMFCSR